MAIDVYLKESEIKERIQKLAQIIEKDYNGQEVVVIGILNGSFMFLSDLVRSLSLPIQIEFMAASSYGDGTVSSGELKIKLDLNKSIAGRHVIVVEDIVDTGLTLSILKKNLLERNPASLKICSLLFKPARLEHPVEIDYLGFEIPDKFVIGYGLDYAGRYRELPYIGIYREEES